LNRIRLLIVDDHVIVREGLRSLLESEANIEIVGEAGDGQEGVQKTLELQPDIILMDIRMTPVDGVEATRQIKALRPGSKILILTSYDEDEQVFEAIRAGASGYVLKDVHSDQLLRAISAVADGYSLMSPPIARKLQNEFQRIQKPRGGAPEEETSPLTPRENEVLALIARGHNNREIAASLSISEKTVKTHIGNLFAKLQISDRSQAVVYAARRGLVT
jgi:DNA-binding NarL/FixJ family response regulator